MLGQTDWPLAEIWEAEDSTQALEICRTEPVDLVFCDLHLANLHSKSGLEVIRELRLLLPKIPIFMVTAENNEALIRLVCAVGATGHLLKPISLRTLRSIL